MLVTSLNNLFISKVRIKILKYFLFNPDTPLHLRGIVREVQEEINAVRRELERLEAITMIMSESRGNRKYFFVNKSHPFYADLLAMFHKTFGLGGLILKSINELGHVDFALLTGTFTGASPKVNATNVDMLLIGQVDMAAVDKLVKEAEQKMNREINYMVMKTGEFILKKKRRDQFILEIMVNNRIMLAGSNDDFIS